jgi:hypothetical protein
VVGGGRRLSPRELVDELARTLPETYDADEATVVPWEEARKRLLPDE